MKLRALGSVASLVLTFVVLAPEAASALDRFPIVVPAGARASFDSGSFTQVRQGGVHHAVDISVMREGRALEGPEVVAPVAGRVLREWQYGRDRFPGVTRDVPSARGGWYVWMRGVDGRFYYFAHLMRPSPLTPGQEVRAGDHIGFVGRSGNVQGRPHLHFAIRTTRGVVDPYPELRAVVASAQEPVVRSASVASVIAAAVPRPSSNANGRRRDD